MRHAEETVYSVRAMQPRDAASVCAIYNQGIDDRLATLETRKRTPAEQADWLDRRDPRHPVFVAELDARVVGWGSLNSFNQRSAYDHVADFSVYVERAYREHGVGRTLVERLVESSHALGYHKMVLAMFPFNEPGKALYKSLGFRVVGVYEQQGRLDGRWVDILIMEKLL